MQIIKYITLLVLLFESVINDYSIKIKILLYIYKIIIIIVQMYKKYYFYH